MGTKRARAFSTIQNFPWWPKRRRDHSPNAGDGNIGIVQHNPISTGNLDIPSSTELPMLQTSPVGSLSLLSIPSALPSSSPSPSMRDLAESKRTRSQFLSKIIKDGLYHIHSMASRVAEGAQARFGRKALGLSKGLSTGRIGVSPVACQRKKHGKPRWTPSTAQQRPALSALAEVFKSAEDGFVTASMAFEDARALPRVSHAFMMTADALGVVTELLELVHSGRQCTGYQAQIVVEDRLRVMSRALNGFEEAAAAFAGTVFRSTVVDALMSAGNVVQGLLLWTSSHAWVVCDTGDRDAAKDDDTAVPDIATVQDGLRFDLALVATKFADVAEAYRWGFEPEEQPADKEELTRPHDSTPAIAPSSTPDPSSPPNHPYQPYSDWNILPSSSPPPEARSTEPSHFVPPPDPALCKVAPSKATTCSMNAFVC